MKRWKNSLFIKILFLAGIIFSVLFVTYIVMIWYVIELNENYVSKLNDRTLGQIQSDIEKFCDSLDHVATALVYSPTTYEYFAMNSEQRVINTESMNTVYMNITLLEDDIVGVYLYDSDMQKICVMGQEVKASEQMDFLYEKKEHMEFSNVFTMEQYGTSYYVLYFPVYDISNHVYGKQIGMSAFVLRTSSLEDIIKDVCITNYMELYLLDSNETVVATNKDMEIETLPQSKMISNADFYVQSVDLELDGWKIVSRFQVNELVGTSKLVFLAITIAYLFASVLIFFLLRFYYKQLVIPVYQIDAFIKNIVANPEARMISEREDELGAVIDSLNHMLDEKQKLDAEVKESQHQMYEMELAKKQLQVLAYQNQINPHFLYNTFDCIRAMAMYHDADEIAEITLALSHVFRYAVKGENIVKVEEEVVNIQKYASIIDYRFNGKIGLIVHMDEAIKKKQIIKLILQPLVENAVFHGLEQKIEGGTVEVHIQMADKKHIRFTIEDNGCGMTKDRLKYVMEHLDSKETGHGIGLSNIYRRLNLFYKEDIVFRIESSLDKGTKVEIVIPDKVKDGGMVHV